MKDIILLNFNPQFAIAEIFTPQAYSNSPLQRSATATACSCKHTAQQILLQVAASALSPAADNTVTGYLRWVSVIPPPLLHRRCL